jgi:mannose-6-phosphate isomerase-like protein (cupin superfamily)
VTTDELQRLMEALDDLRDFCEGNDPATFAQDRDPVERRSRCRGIRVHHPVETPFTIAWNTHTGGNQPCCGGTEVTCHDHAGGDQVGRLLAVAPARCEVRSDRRDPKAADVLFAYRLKMPDNYRIAPHFHPADEHLVVISGTFNMGLGDKLDPNATRPMTAGSFIVMPKGTHH